jgi:GxxExxY protein
VSPEIEMLADRVVNAAIEVHSILGPGFQESAYEDALCQEFTLRNFQFGRQHEVFLTYKGIHIGKGRIDLWVERKLILELKAVDTLLPVHHAQVISYLKLTGCEMGLLLNFNTVLLKHGMARVVHPSLIR